MPHGSFLPWIEAEFGMNPRTAQRFMGVAETFKGKYDTVSHLDPKALYELAAPKTPIEVREEVERMIAAGEVVRAADGAEEFARSNFRLSMFEVEGGKGSVREERSIDMTRNGFVFIVFGDRDGK